MHAQGLVQRSTDQQQTEPRLNAFRRRGYWNQGNAPRDNGPGQGGIASLYKISLNV
jgi:hypothetical protein